MGKQDARRFGGHLILSGVLCLFSAMLLAIPGMFLVARFNSPAGEPFLALAKLFAALWLPLVGIGAFVRVTNPDTEDTSSIRADDDTTS